MYMTNDGELGQEMRSNMFSLSGTGFFGAVGRSLNLGRLYVLELLCKCPCSVEAQIVISFN